jgi:hypothetical protein
VIQQDSRARRLRTLNRPSVDENRVVRRRPVTELRDLAVYGDAPGLDPGLDLTPRPEAGGGEDLL